MAKKAVKKTKRPSAPKKVKAKAKSAPAQKTRINAAAKKKTPARRVRVNPEEARARVEKIFPILVKTHPDAKTSLDHTSAFELLVATIMAAQCTDERVNIVTKDLFKKYRGPADFAAARQEELEEDIRSTGFFRNKAKNIIAMSRSVMEKFGGRVPGNMHDLLKLAGVGRKTANVILGNCFDVPGIVCDTHVIRLSRRLGLSAHEDPVKLEFDLREIVPERKWGGWTLWSHLIVFHGRRICNARKPRCSECPISVYCPSANRPDLW